MKFNGEIVYPGVHSDIDFNLKGEEGKELTQQDRQRYHDLLDEWLSNSNGQGVFYLCGEEHLPVFPGKYSGKLVIPPATFI